METTDVLVVGSGPTGLLLAGDLARRGVDCTLVEKRANESNLTRAFAVHARTLEQFDARGVADELVRTGTRVDTLQALGGVEMRLSRLPGRFPYVLVTPQYETERVLEERALGLGVRSRRGVEVVGLRQDGDGVDVDLRDAEGRADTLRASYVVGTDGLHSTVRRALGLSFPGRTAIQSVILADARLTDPPAGVLTVETGKNGLVFLVPFGDGYHRVIAWDSGRQLPDDAPVDLDEVRDVVRRVHGDDYGMTEARWLSRFHSDERQAPRYRVGRVFLAGDAAHVHSPAGGQGMNAGLQDAANLSWRLTLAVRGQDSTELLDGYEAERHPVGRAILLGSGVLLRLGMARTPLTRLAGRVLAFAGRHARIPMRAPMAVSGLGVRYRRPRHAHELVGGRVPDAAVLTAAGERLRLYEALRPGRFVLRTPPDGDLSATDWPEDVETVRAAEPSATTTLVRPDGYVGWAADHATSDTARDALVSWFGPPGR